MTILVLLILAAIWALVLIPPFLRTRAEGRPADSIVDFRRQLGVLQRTAPHRFGAANSLHDPYDRPVLAPPVRGLTPAAVRTLTADARRRRTIKRRRDVFVGLLAAMGVSLVLSRFGPLSALIWAHVLLDLAFAGYVAVLVQLRNLSAEREVKVRYLPTSTAPVEPALLARSSVH